MNRFKSLPFCLSMLVTITGCVSIPDKSYEYRSIHESALHSDMRAMATSLRVLAELNFDTEISAVQQQGIVQRELSNVERIATGIGGGDVITNYSVINRYMGAFLYDVGLAKEFADRDPPNYVPANRLIKSCLSCHSSI